MSVLNFAEEFSRLIIRYTKTHSPSNSNPAENAPLTADEVKNAVHSVFVTYFGSAITPTVVDLPQINQERNNENTFRSEPAVAALDFDSSSRTDGGEAKNSLETLQKEKKFISRSNPAIHVSSIGRSDTFIREENEKTDAQDNSDDDVFINAENGFLQSLNETQKSVMDIALKLDNLKKQVREIPQLKRIQRLSSSNGVSNHDRISSRTAIPKIRRSITAFSRTPTSSRSVAVGKIDVLNRRKSISGVPCGNSRKLTESVTTTVNLSTSTLNLSTTKKISPSSIVRPAKNPKYAHVQSTIPKPMKQINKRKIQ